MSEVRLIDANALKNTVRAQEWKKDTAIALTVDWICMLIDEAPAVDAVPVVRGKWIPNQHWEYRNGNTTMSGDTGLGCSACGAVNFTGINQRTPFCPRCGARMDGEP
jgi:NADH pyrophosphatase NudC (nudix superfamily)